MWKVGNNRWAIGLDIICEAVPNDAAVPDDALADWKDDDQERFCVRPRLEKLQPDTERESAEMLQGPVWPVWNSAMAIFKVGKGVIVKAKWCGEGGSSREGAAMELIRQRAPGVCVPEPLYHWKDEKWFCYFIIMRQAPGCSLDDAWFSLKDEHKRRLMMEAAIQLKMVGDITSPLAIHANGDALCSSGITKEADFVDPDTENPPGPGPFTPVQLYEWQQKKQEIRPLVEEPPLPTENFHFCHMSPIAEKIFISDGKPLPSWEGKHSAIRIPPERQAGLRISGIIDWGRSGFFPRWMVSYQIKESLDHHVTPWNADETDYSEVDFDRGMISALVKLGCDNPDKVPSAWT